MAQTIGDVLSVLSQGLFKDGAAASGTFPAASLVYYGTVYGPNDTDYTGTLLAPPDNPVTNSGWDDEFEGVLTDIFDTGAGAVNATYASAALGVDVPVTILWIAQPDSVDPYDAGDTRKRRGELYLRDSEIAEPRPDADSLTHDGVTYTVTDILAHQGGVWVLSVVVAQLKQVRGIDRRAV